MPGARAWRTCVSGYGLATAVDHGQKHKLGGDASILSRGAGRLTTIPGVAALAAAGITAEIGCDMSRFATPAI
jgi:transposase